MAAALRLRHHRPQRHEIAHLFSRTPAGLHALDASPQAAPRAAPRHQGLDYLDATVTFRLDLARLTDRDKATTVAAPALAGAGRRRRLEAAGCVAAS